MLANLLLITLVVLAVIITFFRPMVRKIRNHRHSRNIRRAAVILTKIRKFRGEHSRARIMAYLRKVSPYVMEELVLTAFESIGIRVRRSRRYSGDGGADGCIFWNNHSYLVQTKRYRGHIDVQHVRNFERTIGKENAAGGLFIHTGRTGRASWDCLKGSRIRILSGDHLLSLLLGVRDEINELIIALSEKRQTVSNGSQVRHAGLKTGNRIQFPLWEPCSGAAALWLPRALPSGNQEAIPHGYKPGNT